MQRIIFATTNENKMKEIREILSDFSVEIFSLKEAGIKADIDENGMIHRIVPLSDTLFQYSKVIIDQIYDKAVRGWQPATRNGVPCRSLVQMKFELKK